jgi:spermidine synthase
MPLVLALHPQASTALHLGLGGGVLPSFLHRHSALSQVAVELHQEVVEAARQFFSSPPDDSRFRVVVASASDWLSRCRDRFDLIFLDTIGSDASPDETAEFLRAVRGVLNPGGWVCGNVWANNLARRFRPWRQVFKPVLHAGPFQGQNNLVVFAGTSDSTPLLADILEAAARLAGTLPLEMADLASALRT